jgi:hypothetical protein
MTMKLNVNYVIQVMLDVAQKRRSTNAKSSIFGTRIQNDASLPFPAAFRLGGPARVPLANLKFHFRQRHREGMPSRPDD